MVDTVLPRRLLDSVHRAFERKENLFADDHYVLHFIDDQGYDADLYFTDAEENTFKVIVKKLAGTNI